MHEEYEDVGEMDNKKSSSFSCVARCTCVWLVPVCVIVVLGWEGEEILAFAERVMSISTSNS